MYSRKTHPVEGGAWSNMIQRCYNPNNENYWVNGAAGIGVCSRWRSSPHYFIEDMGPRPAGLSLQRRDIWADYSPENCYWGKRQQRIPDAEILERGLTPDPRNRVEVRKQTGPKPK